ncbi:MAG: TonB-dependent receptor [Pseudomonadota bacterium]
MKNRSSRLPVALLPLAIFPLAAAFPLHAQTAAPQLAETVVTATRVPEALSDLVADVSIVDRDTIERSGATGVADVLARLPGVEIVRNGGAGNATSVYLRGAESRFTAVYIDGVRIDSQSTGGAIWEQIPLSQIDRIEVLRGPAAAVYGSDAIGGVIQLFTKKGEPGFHPFVGIGAGNHGTRKIEAGASGTAGVDGAFDYSLGLAREISTGFNSRPLPTQNPDLDGYRSTSANAKIGFRIDARNRIEGTLLGNNMNSQYDSSLKANDVNKHELRTGGLTWLSQWTDAYSTRLQVTESRSSYETLPSPYLTITELRNYLFQNEYRSGPHLFTAALERREDHLRNDPIDRSRSQNALALGYGLVSGPHSLQLNARHDDDSEFGGHNTGSAAYGFSITPQWRVTASAGTAFRAPTLFQRFSQYGLGSLQPETSHNIEAGLKWAQGASSAGVVVYRNKVDNLITFAAAGGCASTLGCYRNTAHAEYKGMTFSAAQRVGEVSLRGSLDVQDPRDTVTGKLLARRSRQHASFGADTQLAGWTLGAEVQASGSRFDDAANTQRLGGYTLVNLYASTRVARDYTVLARIDNLANKPYELARTYATPGRVLYVGLKWAPL